MKKKDKSLLDQLHQIVQIITLTMTIIGLVKKFMDWNNEQA